MSLDVYLTKVVTEEKTVHDSNITHNLNEMAGKAGIYMELWRPDEIGVTKAFQLIDPLKRGLAKLKADPEFYQQFDSPNGWGVYEHFVQLWKSI